MQRHVVCSFLTVGVVFLKLALVSAVLDFDAGYLPQYNSADIPVPPNNDSCPEDCWCCVHGEPHYDTCDNVTFRFSSPPNRVGNMASPGQGWWWYLWTSHAYAPGQAPLTYVDAIKFRCDSFKLKLLLPPMTGANKHNAPLVLLKEGDGNYTNLPYPADWHDKLDPTAPATVLKTFTPTPDHRGYFMLSVENYSFNKCHRGVEKKYVAAHCFDAETGSLIAAVYVRLRTVIVKISGRFCNELHGICGNFDQIRSNDETILTNTVPWGPLLFPAVGP